MNPIADVEAALNRLMDARDVNAAIAPAARSRTLNVQLAFEVVTCSACVPE